MIALPNKYHRRRKQREKKLQLLLAIVFFFSFNFSSLILLCACVLHHVTFIKNIYVSVLYTPYNSATLGAQITQHIYGLLLLFRSYASATKYNFIQLL